MVQPITASIMSWGTPPLFPHPVLTSSALKLLFKPFSKVLLLRFGRLEKETSLSHVGLAATGLAGHVPMVLYSV